MEISFVYFASNKKLICSIQVHIAFGRIFNIHSRWLGACCQCQHQSSFKVYCWCGGGGAARAECSNSWPVRRLLGDCNEGSTTNTSSGRAGAESPHGLPPLPRAGRSAARGTMDTMFTRRPRKPRCRARRACGTHRSARARTPRRDHARHSRAGTGSKTAISARDPRGATLCLRCAASGDCRE